MKINNFKTNKKKAKFIPSKTGRRGGSINAKLVAEDVKNTVANGGKVALAKIIRKRGYSEPIARNPNRVTKQSAYKEAMDPFVEKMIKRRDAAIKLMATREKRANYSHLVDAVDKMTKNIQLLTGKETERSTDIKEYMNALNKLMGERMKK